MNIDVAEIRKISSLISEETSCDSRSRSSLKVSKADDDGESTSSV